MASIKTTQMNGDLSLGRDIVTGGKARIAGSATIGHNLKVNGWLEAPNIKGVTKGIFKTLAELNAAYPEPEDGWLAGVGTSSPFTAYIAKDGSWVATGGTIATTIDVPGLENGLQELQTSVNAVVAEATEVIQQGVEDINEIKAELLAENAELFNAAVASINPTTVIEGDVENAADEEDLTSVEVSGAEVLKFKDKAYSPLTYSGMGRVHLRKNMVSSTAGGVTVVKNVLTQDMLYKGEVGSRVPNTNTVFEVQYDYDLNGATITIPEGSVLKFNGGKLDNGKVVFQDNAVESAGMCFGPDLEIEGKVLEEASPEWFTGSDADKIEQALNTFNCVKLAARDYLIDRQIEVHHSFKLVGSGFGDMFGEGNSGTINDLSSSRLVATDAFNNCVVYDTGSIPEDGGDEDTNKIEPSDVSFEPKQVPPAMIKVSRTYTENEDGKYVSTEHCWYSIHIEGVSFIGKKVVNIDENDSGFRGYGLEICTVNGPSRPINIINCNFKYFLQAISINNDGVLYHYSYNNDNPVKTNYTDPVTHITSQVHAIAQTSTNVGVLNVKFCNITQNYDGINISGHHALMMASIVGNNLEWNLRGSIYAMDNSERAHYKDKAASYTVPIFNAIKIENNILEGQEFPISLRAGKDSYIEIKGNYFESAILKDIKGNPIKDEDNKNIPIGQTITIEGLGIASRPRIDICGNSYTSSTQNLKWNLKSCDVNISDNRSDSNEFYIETCVCHGTVPKKIASASGALFENNPCNSTEYDEIAHYYPEKNAILNGSYYKKNYSLDPAGEVVTASLGSKTLAKGKYRLVTKVKSWSSTNSFGLKTDNVNYSFRPVIATDKEMWLISDMDIEVATSGAALITLSRVYPNGYYMGDIVIAAVPDNTYIVPNLPVETYNVEGENIWDGAVKGTTIYDTTANKKAAYLGEYTILERQTEAVTGGGQEDTVYGIYISNTCVSKAHYRLSFAQTINYNKKMIFCKEINTEEVGGETKYIPPTGDTVVVFDSSLSNPTVFDAPDSAVYPYIFLSLKLPSSYERTFYIDKVCKKWVEADGAKAGVPRSGTFAAKPSAADIYVGFRYFCTDMQTTEGETDGIEIIHKGSDVWVDALGRTVEAAEASAEPEET